MSASPTGPVRPARLAGFILLGVAVVAVGLGIFALADSAAGQTSSSGPTSGVTAPETIPHTTTTPKPTTTTTVPPTTTTTAPTTSFPSGQTTTVVPAPPAGTGPAAPPVQVRVYNNSKIQGLAARAAAELTADGFDVVAVSGYSQGIIPNSTAYYTSAPGEQDTAQQIGQKLGIRVEPRFPGIADASPGVIVIVTKDFQG